MIRTIKHKGLKRLYEKGDRSKLPADRISRIEDILSALDTATSLKDLDRPSFRLHSLTGDRRGTYSVWVSGNWRITFEFDEPNFVNINLVDYH